MELLREKIAYLKGLAEGLNVDEGSKEGKLFLSIIDVLDEVAQEMHELVETQDEITDYVEELDEDLSDLEEEFYDEESDSEEFEDEEEDLDDEFYEVQCPNCNDTIVVDEDAFVNEDVVICPNCKTEIEFEVDECECNDCHCGDDHEK